MDIREVLQNRILLMDGAMGTYFKSLHFDSNEAEVPEKAMLTSPVWIKDIHKEFPGKALINQSLLQSRILSRIENKSIEEIEKIHGVMEE